MPDKIHPQAQIGIDLFDRGEYYDAHEPLEEAWMETLKPERKLYQGILQIGLAYYQIGRGNFRGALKMFKRGQKNLSKLEDIYFGVNVRQFQDDARVVENEIRDLGEDRMSELSNDYLKPLPTI
jgi:predicted metal-dependent hydrolase